MPYRNRIGIALVLFMVAISTAAAHSLKELETRLGEREKYFQPIYSWIRL